MWMMAAAWIVSSVAASPYTAAGPGPRASAHVFRRCERDTTARAGSVLHLHAAERAGGRRDGRGPARPRLRGRPGPARVHRLALRGPVLALPAASPVPRHL